MHLIKSFHLVEQALGKDNRRMKWQERYLDVVLVPSGLLLLIGYHLFLLCRCIRSPKDTVIGFENHSCKIWVNKMIQVDLASRGPAFTIMSSNISAATFMSSTSLALTSLIGAWIGGSSNNMIVSKFIYGDTRDSIKALKYVSIVGFFLVAFGCYIQSARSFVHSNFLLSMPQTDVPVEFVEDAISRGHSFWELGLRATYFAAILLMWVFGPIPMFASSVFAVIILHHLDRNKKPLQEFPTPNRFQLKNVCEEIASVTMAIHHNGTPQCPQGMKTSA